MVLHRDTPASQGTTCCLCREALGSVPAGLSGCWNLSWTALRSPWSTDTAEKEGAAPESQYGTHIFKPELNGEVFTIQFIQATFWLFSVWIATLMSKHESTENSEVAFICVCLTKRYSKTTFCSDLAKPIHSLETIKWQNIRREAK